MSKNKTNKYYDYDDIYDYDDEDYYDDDDSYPTPKPKQAPVKKANTSNIKIDNNKKNDNIISKMTNVSISKTDSQKVSQSSTSKTLTPKEIMLSTQPKYNKKIKQTNEKETLNLIIAGHVDAGKSTIMGHLLFQCGNIDKKTMHKYKKDSEKIGKSSFAFAWALDQTTEERERGITIGAGRASFQTKSKNVIVLDAPGHKDFVPNMISSATQADAAILVINATKGEFETGLNEGGQTREHAILLGHLGISNLIVAVNKLDTVNWDEIRFKEIISIIDDFLKNDVNIKNISYIPISGLEGINLVEKPINHPLSKWYHDNSLLEAIDSISVKQRDIDKPLRIVINSVFNSTSTSVVVGAKIESGFVEKNEKLFIIPLYCQCTVKNITLDDSSSPLNTPVFAGEQIIITLAGTFEENSISNGFVLCRGGSEALIPISKFTATINIFDIQTPIIKGTRCELFAHSLCVPCNIKKLKKSIDKKHNIEKEKPRMLLKNSLAIVQIATDSPVNLEEFNKCQALGRFSLRASGQTIAAGIIESCN
ncbi:HBS1-like protein [Strongyloides ratti]|uniref:HBS1-like protein n=1 Tax=Strongyloides ratti TaxID=34506 RepID=A0A090LCP8_STRRB|nr:HBS1-like protein [Strongyloides ratti]CEF67542.1 HBS1-like protein [Strongyloides ratti]